MNKNLPNDSGVALLELAISVPLVLVVILVGFQFAITLQTYQQMAMISREAGSSSLRECAKRLCGSFTAADLVACQQCAEDQAAKAVSSGSSMAPGAVVVVSIYYLDRTIPASPVVRRAGLYPPPAAAQGFTSKYSTSHPVIRSLLDADNNSLAVSEVFYNTSRLPKFIKFLFTTTNKDLYETAIF